MGLLIHYSCPPWVCIKSRKPGPPYSSDPATVKAAIALLKQRRPGTKVLISVGGATYTAWDQVRCGDGRRTISVIQC